MRSGELARRAGISADTIRHYERLGLLKAPPRNRSGYRDYPADALLRVTLIRQALRLGFSLDELAGILRVRDGGGIPCRTVFASTKSKLAQVEQRIQDLKTMRALLRRILQAWRARLAGTPRDHPARLLENLPAELEDGAGAHAS